MKPELKVYPSKTQDEMKSEKWPSKSWMNKDCKNQRNNPLLGREIAGKSYQGRQNDRP